jgi:hypothetical protein
MTFETLRRNIEIAPPGSGTDLMESVKRCIAMNRRQELIGSAPGLPTPFVARTRHPTAPIMRHRERIVVSHGGYGRHN